MVRYGSVLWATFKMQTDRKPDCCTTQWKQRIRLVSLTTAYETDSFCLVFKKQDTRSICLVFEDFVFIVHYDVYFMIFFSLIMSLKISSDFC